MRRAASTPPAAAADPGSARALAHLSPGGLGLVTSRAFRFPPHVELIDREVTEAVARADARLREGTWSGPEILLVEVPPRHGKSTEISEHTPAWFLGRYPDRRVALCSYQGEFAATWGLKARALLEEYGHRLYGVKVDPNSRSSKRWGIQGRKGGMVTTGVGGPLTGQGAHLLIVDDPVKNAEEAMSDTIREKHKEWWRSTARTRVEPGGVVVVLMTRWHDDDLGGFLLKESKAGGDPVREIRLPAIAEEGDPLGRKPGEALWPERFSREALDKLKKALGAYWFAAMFQGTPTPDEGGIFNRKDFRYFRVEGDQVVLETKSGEKRWGIQWCRKFQTVDWATSEKETADYTVVTECWVTPENELLIRNVTRDRIPGPDQPAFYKNHNQGLPTKVEGTGAYGSHIVKSLLHEGLPIEPVYPDSDKVTRAAAAGALYRGERVFHLQGAEWLGDFEVELLAFPAGEHDDQVDTISYAARALPDLATTTLPKTDKRTRQHTAGLRTKQL